MVLQDMVFQDNSYRQSLRIQRLAADPAAQAELCTNDLNSTKWFEVRSQPKRTIRNLPDPKIHPSAVKQQKNKHHAKFRKIPKQVSGYRYVPFVPKQV